MPQEEVVLPGPVYLGDAVYASFDGFHIWLHLNSHLSPGLIALETNTLDALDLYRKRCMEVK